MARSCLFTYKSLLAASLQRNIEGRFTLRSIAKNGLGAANIHILPSLQQKAQFQEEEEFSENLDDQRHNELKIKILKAGLNFVPEHGWTEQSLANGVKSLGLSPAAHTLVEGGGPELVNYFNFLCNLKLEDHMKEVSSKNKQLDLQEFIIEALEYRLKLIIPFVPRWPEAMALMVLPTQFPAHTQNMLQLVDSIWHFYGDTSLDTSWYGKRFALLAAYKASELSLIQDKSSDYTETFEFLQRRVEDVLEAKEVAETVDLNLKHLQEFGGGFFITARNVLGLRKWLG